MSNPSKNIPAPIRHNMRVWNFPRGSRSNLSPIGDDTLLIVTFPLCYVRDSPLRSSIQRVELDRSLMEHGVPLCLVERGGDALECVPEHAVAGHALVDREVALE